MIAECDFFVGCCALGWNEDGGGGAVGTDGDLCVDDRRHRPEGPNQRHGAYHWRRLSGESSTDVAVQSRLSNPDHRLADTARLYVAAKSAKRRYQRVTDAMSCALCENRMGRSRRPRCSGRLIWASVWSWPSIVAMSIG